MNDLVAKLFDQENLFSTLLKWLPVCESNARVLQQNIVDDDSFLRKQLRSIYSIDTDVGLRNLCGDVKVYYRFLRQFKSLHGDDIDKLDQIIKSDKVNEAVAITHNLRGAAGTLGLTEIQDAASQL